MAKKVKVQRRPKKPKKAQIKRYQVTLKMGDTTVTTFVSATERDLAIARAVSKIRREALNNSYIESVSLKVVPKAKKEALDEEDEF